MDSHRSIVDKLITIEKKNTLLNHIITSYTKGGETIAEKKCSDYIVWTSNYFTGVFYPIFIIRFDDKNQIENIKSKLSLYGKFWGFILGVVIMTFLTILVITPIIEDFKHLDYIDFIGFIIYILIALGICLVLRNIYLNETKNLLNDLKLATGIVTIKDLGQIESLKKEWTFKKILERLVLYPTSIFILFMSIYMIFNWNLRGLLGVLVTVAYLYTDIKIIYNKKRTSKIK